MENWKFNRTNTATRVYRGKLLIVESVFLISHKWTKPEEYDEELWKWSVTENNNTLISGHETTFSEACRAAEFATRELL